MGIFDKAKDLVGKAGGDKVGDALDKAGDMVDEKTGGKFGDKIDMAKEKAAEALGADIEAEAPAEEE